MLGEARRDDNVNGRSFEIRFGTRWLQSRDTAMTVLITGGAGFIGTRLVRRLLNDVASNEIVVLDNLHPQVHGDGAEIPVMPAGARFFRADVTDAASWDALLVENRPEVVVHLAAETGTGQSLRESSRHSSVNVHGTATMMDAFSRHDHVPRRIVLTSSRAVYGEGLWRTEDGSEFYGKPRTGAQLRARRWEPEDANRRTGVPLGHDARKVHPMPSNVYAATKLAQEHLLSAWSAAFGSELVVLRLQNVYGGGQALNNPYTGVLTFFATQIIGGKDLDIFEGGGIVRDFVHVSDVVSAIAAARSVQVCSSVVYDIGSGEPGTLLDFARVLIDVSGKPVKARVSDNFREGDVRAAFAEIEHARRELGYEPKVSFREGAKDLLTWAAVSPAPRVRS